MISCVSTEPSASLPGTVHEIIAEIFFTRHIMRHIREKEQSDVVVWSRSSTESVDFSGITIDLSGEFVIPLAP